MLIRLPLWLSSTIREIFTISFDLFKLMVPVIIIVKLIEELGGIQTISTILEPVMQLVGLPASTGLVWATTMLTNIYGGMIIFITTSTEPLSIAQVTVLGTMMLLAHALPIEVRIAQKAGVRVFYTLLLRIGGALLLGFLLHQFYTASNTLTEANHPVWKPIISNDPSLLAWGISQLKSLFQVFLVIAALVIFLKLLKLSGIERLLEIMLKPLLKVLGLSEKTTSITIIGITLGLTYGGGLLINEAKHGKLTSIDIFGALSLLAICHSLIEDTLLIMLLGADLSGILYARLIFSLLLVAIIIRLARHANSQFVNRFFLYPNQ